jgi:hypothetical protein
MWLYMFVLWTRGEGKETKSVMWSEDSSDLAAMLRLELGYVASKQCVPWHQSPCSWPSGGPSLSLLPLWSSFVDPK